MERAKQSRKSQSARRALRAAPLAGSGTVVSDMPFLRVRENPGTQAAIAGNLKNGSRVQILESGQDPQQETWYRIRVTLTSPSVFADEALTVPLTQQFEGWCVGSLIQLEGATPVFTEPVEPTPILPPISPVPIPAATLPEIGINWIGGGPGAWEALNKGCRAIGPSFNPAHGMEIKRKYPDRYTVVRGMERGNPADIGEWRRLVKIDELEMPPGTIILGLNEDDNGLGQGKPDEIKRRAEFDAQAWEVCKSKGLIYAGGGFSVSQPDIRKPEICQAMRTHYAPLLNAGMWFNQHCYMTEDGSGLPLRQRFIETQEIDLMGRHFTMRQSWQSAEYWRLYCAVCGFDSLRCWYGDDNRMYPSPFKFGLVFQAGSKDPKWRPYDIEDRVDEIAAHFWQLPKEIEAVGLQPAGRARRGRATKTGAKKAPKKTKTARTSQARKTSRKSSTK